jgi:murein DD-endopeptidase MepM/ murein hydrolase activator NlpD
VSALVQATSSPIPAPEGPTHVVAAGDNLWTIARRHAADLGSIIRSNVGVDPDRLVAGQRILVPGGSRMKPLPPPTPVESRTAPVPAAASDRRASPQAQSGDHLWPLPIRGDLTRRFSAAHPAIDIAAPQGTKVRAIADGTVVWSGWKDNGGGFVVEVAHPDGMRSTYNHNSKLIVAPGDEVAQGETIALVGSTGWSTGPHLDLRVWMNGRLVDPLRFY